MKTGKFITIEGCDGCGKSTQTERLKEYFDKHGFAYVSTREQHLSDTVAPALEAGKIVLCDRYVDSSFAYQAAGRGLGDKFVASINAYAIERFTPDATIFIDLPPREAFLRKHGADKNDRMELAGEAFHERVYRGFLKQARENKERFIVVDGRKSKDEMFADILAALKQRKIIP